MSSIINKVKDALSSDSKNTSSTHHDTTTHHTGTAAEPRTHGTYEDSRIPQDGSLSRTDNYGVGQEANRGYDGPAPKTDGPHKSDLLNKMDPRVDSNNDHSTNLGMNPPGDATTGFKKDSSTLPSGQVHSGRTDTTTGGISEGTYGTHNSRVANAADPRIDSDLDSRRTHDTSGLSGTHNTSGAGLTGTSHNTTGTGLTGTHNTSSLSGTHNTSGLSGTHNTSGAGLTGTSHNTTGTGFTGTTTSRSENTNIREGEFGPHSSRMANAADPRVDSDLDSRRTQQSSTGAAGIAANTAFNSSQGSTTGHSSRVANTVDPRIDSDSHHTQQREGGVFSSTTRNAENQGVREGEFGTHNSRVANAADPRIDSDLDGRNKHTSAFGGAAGTSTTATSGLRNTSTQSGAREGDFGPHSSRVANAADPRVDSDLDSSRRNENQTFGSERQAFGGENQTFSRGGENLGSATGPAPNTAGPHSSDMMNKADPRVDSDLDNSKTYGGDKTFEQGSNLGNKDPTDAAQVPPSVLQKTIGKPVLQHDDLTHDRTRRHSYDKNEKHSGL